MDNKYRPCIVKTGEITDTWKTISGKSVTIIIKEAEEHKALFHCWSHKFWTVDQISKIVGIVEYEDGSIHEVYPSEIRFVDNKAKAYMEMNNADT